MRPGFFFPRPAPYPPPLAQPILLASLNPQPALALAPRASRTTRHTLKPPSLHTRARTHTYKTKPQHTKNQGRPPHRAPHRRLALPCVRGRAAPGACQRQESVRRQDGAKAREAGRGACGPAGSAREVGPPPARVRRGGQDWRGRQRRRRRPWQQRPNKNERTNEAATPAAPERRPSSRNPMTHAPRAIDQTRTHAHGHTSHK